MKKSLLSIAALLLGLLAHSQEADDLGNYAEVSIIPRLDLNPSWNTANSAFGFDLGNSSLYTLFEGSASEHSSWTVANHWIAAGWWLEDGVDLGEMFRTLGYSDTTNWIDFLKADLSFGNWTLTLGKDCMSTGGWEYDDWDWDVHPLLASPLWNGLACYQWGGKVAFTTPSEMTTLSLQMTTSPFGERPFSSGLYTYSFQLAGEYGWFAPLWSVSLLEREADPFSSAPKDHDLLVSLGNRFLLGDWTFTLDWTNTSGLNWDYSRLQRGQIFHGRLDYAPSDRFDVSLRGNYTVFNDEYIADVDGYFQNWWTVGAVCQFYPLRDSQDLRLHALVNYDTWNQLSFSFGVLYNLRLKLW